MNFKYFSQILFIFLIIGHNCVSADSISTDSYNNENPEYHKGFAVGLGTAEPEEFLIGDPEYQRGFNDALNQRAGMTEGPELETATMFNQYTEISEDNTSLPDQEEQTSNNPTYYLYGDQSSDVNNNGYTVVNPYETFYLATE